MSVSAEASHSEQRGGYRPEKPIQMIPLLRWPLRPMAIFKWLFGFPGYLWPLHAAFVGLALLTWLYLTPDVARMHSLSADWVALILVRNLALVLAVAGALHMLLYLWKTQGTQYKYDARWPAVDNPNFLFRDQVRDNIFWTLCSGVPVWTAYEVLILWLQANGSAPVVSWQAHPAYCVLLILLMEVWHSIYFYAVHRALHWHPLYRWVHSIHHKNVNIGPWSGIAMHPIEHLLYFSEVMIYAILPSHPMHVIFHLQILALGAVLGHVGFDRVMLGRKASIGGDYMHYLHHKHLRVNFGDLLVPLDKWFGTFNDGSDAAHDSMMKCMRERALRMRDAASKHS